MTEPEQVATVEALFAALNRGELEKAAAMLHERVRWPNAAGLSALEGVDEVKQGWEAERKRDTVKLEATRFSHVDGRLVVEVHTQVSDTMGRVLKSVFTSDIFTFEAGRVLQLTSFRSGDDQTR